MFEEAKNLRPIGDIERQKSILKRLQLPLSFTITFTSNNKGEFNINLICTCT